MSYQIIAAFKASMRAEGIEKPPDHIEADGVLHRFHIQGQRPGSLNGAYILYVDGARPAGYFQDFKNDVKISWKFDGPTKQLTQAERAALEATKERRLQERKTRQDKAAKRARAIWKEAKPCQ